jgi:hypothetical protein
VSKVGFPPSEGDRCPADWDRLFLGRGELAGLMQQFDWASTSIGPPERWPQSLKTAVRIMLTSQQPIWIGWGEELIYLYNDPYKSIIGGKHPWALGRPTSAVWSEIWQDIAPLLAKAMGGDEGTYVEAQLLIMERNGFPEETYYTFSYSPIPADDDSPGGIFCANTDDTQRVISERQLSLLRELASSAAESRSVNEACERCASALMTDPLDLPFAMIYLIERQPGRTAQGAVRDRQGSSRGQAHPVPRSRRKLAARGGPCATRAMPRFQPERGFRIRLSHGWLAPAPHPGRRASDLVEQRSRPIRLRDRGPQPVPALRPTLRELSRSGGGADHRGGEPWRRL